MSPIQSTGWLGALIVLLMLVWVKIMSLLDSQDVLNTVLAYSLEFMDLSKSGSPIKYELPTGKRVHLLMTFFIFYMIFLYNVEIHSRLIYPDFEKVPMSPFDLESPGSTMFRFHPTTTSSKIKS